MTSHNPGMPTPQVLEPGGQPCCETGRPVMTDPLTGQTLCSCQYETQQSQLLNFHRLAAAGLSAYGSSAQYTPDAGGVLPLGADPAAFFNPTMPPNGFDIKDNLDAWRMLPYASLYYPYDPSAFAGYPFAAGYAIDINGARRKNATRETTSTLKAWLNEHRKNPYPTKGEKIMLAIITKMTLTQVSTWFANARRRLKKENKMTWEPRNRCDEDDDDLDGDDDDFSDEKEKKRGSGTHESDDEEKKSESYGVRSASEIGKAVTEGSRSISRESLSPKSPGSQDSQRLTTLSPSGSPSITADIRRGDKSDLCSGSSQPKPRIWSIADMATSKISRTSETDGFVPVTSNHQTLIPPGALPTNLHSGSSILPPMITSNWYSPPSATSHLASHRHHPHFPFTSSSPVVTHPAFHGATSPGSNCSSVVSVFNDSMAVASSLTRLRSAAAAATAPLFRSPLNDSPSQSSTPPPSSHTGSTSTIQSPKREILKRDETHSLPSTSDNVKVS